MSVGQSDEPENPKNWTIFNNIMQYTMVKKNFINMRAV